MAGLFDFISLLVTAALFVGVIVGIIFVVQKIQSAINNTKESLEKKGLHITESGMSVKTDRRFDREDYVDATQRGIMKAIGAASFAKLDEKGNHVHGPTPSSISRHTSSSTTSNRLGLRREHSGTKQ